MAKKTEMKHIIKRHGHTEEYDEKKVYGSVFCASLNCHHTDEEAEKMATDIMKKMNKWIKDKKLLTSHEIKVQIMNFMSNEDVELMYKHHCDLC